MHPPANRTSDSAKVVGNSIQVSDSDPKVKIVATSVPIHSCHRVALLDPSAIHKTPPYKQSSCKKRRIKMRCFRVRQFSQGAKQTEVRMLKSATQDSTSQSVVLLLIGWNSQAGIDELANQKASSYWYTS